MTHDPQDAPLTLAAAHEALQRGDGVRAEAIALSLVEAARAQWGPQSPRLGDALSDLATIQATLGRFEDAAFTLRLAWELPAHEDADQRARLTHNMNLGDALRVLGRLDEAEAVLREGLQARAALYGADHPGLAYGLSALAEALYHLGRLQEAHDLTEDAVRILWTNQHPKVSADLAFLAWVRAAGGAAPLDHRLDRLPEDLQLAALQAALDRGDRDPSEPSLGALEALWRWAADRPEPFAWPALQLAAALSNHARAHGAHALRLDACRFTLARLRDQGTDAQELEALLALALACAEADLHDEADALYDEAATLATRLDEPALLSQSLRNRGLWRAQRGRRAEADDDLARAHALPAPDDARARALIAHGIFLQHGGDLDRARALLEAALPLLPPLDHDRLFADNHLRAITQDGDCGCGDMGQTLSAALTQLAQAQLPAGLLDRLELTPDQRLQVHLLREPSEPERDLLQRVVAQVFGQISSN
jgi:tetratricopeptide (TPR) repeat protein